MCNFKQHQQQHQQKKMIKKHVKYISFLLIIFIGFSFVQKKEDIIYWTKDYQLTWDDFLKKAPTGSKNAAISSIVVSPYCRYVSKENTLYFDVTTYFQKNKSWVKKAAKSERALKHEQGHFDINEIYARRLRKTISTFKFKKTGSKSTIAKMFKKNQDELDAEQNLYDKETNYHINEQKQIEWDAKIAKELKELDDYTETHLVIKIK